MYCTALLEIKELISICISIEIAYKAPWYQDSSPHAASSYPAIATIIIVATAMTYNLLTTLS